VGAIADKRSKRSLDLATIARLHDIDLKSDRGRHRRHIPRHSSRCGKLWIDKQTNMRSSRNKLVEKLRLFCTQFCVEETHAGHIAARLAQARNEADLYRIGSRGEDNRNSTNRSLGNETGGGVRAAET